jgi:hypothetical protein
MRLFLINVYNGFKLCRSQLETVGVRIPLRNFTDLVRFQVHTAASMMFRVVFGDILPCKIIVDNHFTRQYIPEDNSEHLQTFSSLLPPFKIKVVPVLDVQQQQLIQFTKLSVPPAALQPKSGIGLHLRFLRWACI